MAPLAGVELEGVGASGFLKRLDAELPPAAGALGVDEPAAPNRPGVDAAVEGAALSLSPPPRLNPPKEGVAAGCEEAGCAAGVEPPPRLKAGALLAGVVLEGAPPPNKPPAGLGVSCELDAAAGAAPPNSPAGVDGVAALFASFEPAAPPNKPVVGVDAPAGLEPNRLDPVPDAGAAGLEAAFPNKPDPDVFAPAWLLFCPSEKPVEAAGACPNRPDAGGGPAGVVEGRAKVLLGAGVAVGVEEPVE